MTLFLKRETARVSRTVYPFPKRQILDSSKLKQFADDSFKLNENGGKFYKRVVNTVRKGVIARYEQFLAPLAVGQRAYVMVRCPSSVRPCVNFFFKHLLR